MDKTYISSVQLLVNEKNEINEKDNSGLYAMANLLAL